VRRRAASARRRSLGPLVDAAGEDPRGRSGRCGRGLDSSRNRSRRPRACSRLSRHFLIMEDADLSDESDQLAWITPTGRRRPRSRRPLRRSSAGPPPASTSPGSAAPLSSFRHGGGRVAPCGLRRRRSGGDGRRLSTAPVERLVPLYGVDMDEQRSPTRCRSSDAPSRGPRAAISDKKRSACRTCEGR